MDAEGDVSNDEDLKWAELIERRKQSGLPQAQKRVVIGYAGEDYQFVEQVKRELEPYVGSIWVDWENVVLFENNLAKEPAFERRIHQQFKDAGLIIFVVSKSWVGKAFPMRELTWALALQDCADKVVSVLLDWSLEDAKLHSQTKPEYAGLLNTLFSLTMLNTKNTIRIHVDLARKVAASLLGLPGVVPKKAPPNWVSRDSDVKVISEQLGMSQQGDIRTRNKTACVIAVEGMSGVGKSALLAHLHDIALPKYVAEHRTVVLVEVGHNADNAKIKDVQKQIVGGLGIPYKDGEDLAPKLQQALGSNGYALFLDDVWQDAADMGHLEDLFGRDWDHLLSKGLGNGSVVVLAGQALPKRSWWHKYRLRELDENSAKELFRKHAFDRDDDGHGLPWEEVVKACARLPLALTVFGRQLYKRDRVKNSPDRVKDKPEWDGVLAALKSAKSPLARLKVAYNLLREEEQKNAFVDIAMHWHGKDWEVVAAALGPEVLAELLRRSLVDKVRHEVYKACCSAEVDVVDMHDLLKDVGKAVAKEDNSWLVDPTPEEVKKSEPRGVWFTKDAEENSFQEGLRKLRVLDVGHYFPAKIHLDQCRKLCWLLWHKIPNTSLELNAANIVWLDLFDGEPRSMIFKKAPTNLRYLDLRGCTSLTSLPELSALTMLESLDLNGCTSLTSLPELTTLIKLESLDLRGCTSLTSLPKLTTMTKLETLDLRGCRSLVSLPELSALTKLEMLDLNGCRSLVSLPELSALTKLETLDLNGCRSLVSLHLEGCTSLTTLRIEGCTSLTTLHLEGCKSLSSLDLIDCRSLPGLRSRPEPHGPDRRFPKLERLNLRGCTLLNLTSLHLNGFTSLRLVDVSALTNLNKLYLRGCTSLTSLPELSALTNLQELDLQYCTSLRSLPELSALINLKELNLQDCTSLTSLPEVSALINLTWLNLRGCTSLTSLAGLLAPKLERLALQGCTSLTSLAGLSALINLTWLDLDGCTSLRSLPELSALINLKELNLRGCTSLTSLAGLSVPNLTSLILRGCTSLTSLAGLSVLNLTWLDLDGCTSLTSLPELSAPRLERLDLTGCTSLRSLPELSALINLKELNLQDCKSLTSLPELSALINLKELNLQDCTSLTSLPEVSALINLKELNLRSCTSLTSLAGLSVLNLTWLDLDGCTSLTSLPELSAPKLERLNLTGCTSLRSLPELSALINLKELSLQDCKSLRSLPELSALINLTWLNLRDCTSLTSLPEVAALTNLTWLNLRGCTSLTSFGGLSELNLTWLDVTGCTRAVIVIRRLPINAPVVQIISRWGL